MIKISMKILTTIILKSFIRNITLFSTIKNPLYLINQGKIGAPQELSSLVKLNVSFTKYLPVIRLTYVNKIVLYSEIDLIKSSESLNEILYDEIYIYI